MDDATVAAGRSIRAERRVTGARAPRAGLELAEVLPDFMLQEIEDDLMRDALVQQLESAMTELTRTSGR